MTKAWLSGKGVPFTEYNISQDKEAGKRLILMGQRVTPVVRVGDEIVVGYSPQKLEAVCNTFGL